MSLKEQLEAEIKDCRFHADLMSLKVKQFRSYDTVLNVILAIASSGCIASWTIWDKYAKYWGGFIALSQLITAINLYFHFINMFIRLTIDATSRSYCFLN